MTERQSHPTGRHFALIELATEKVLRRIPVTTAGGMAVITQEARLRAELGVDEAGSGMALRDSALDGTLDDLIGVPNSGDRARTPSTS